MIEVKCKNCGKQIRTKFKSQLKRRKFCGHKCDIEYKNKNGLFYENQKKRKDLIEKKLKDFKQISNVKIHYKNMNEEQKKIYHILHKYLRKYKKKPLFCEECKKNKPFHLANISGLYKKDIQDYKWVCKSCHWIFDNLVTNFKEAYKKIPRNKYGRFGDEKSLGKIKCLKCKKIFEKLNSNQKYCMKCNIKYNIGHYNKKELSEMKLS